MEVTTLSDTAVKIRGKQTTIAVNPIDIKAKIAVASGLFFTRLMQPLPGKNFEEMPLIIQGPGEYETGGIKISGNKIGESFVYRVVVDGLTLLVAKTSSLAKTKEAVTEYDMLVLEADSIADQSVITALNPSVIIFYGAQKIENAKAMGKEVSPVSKYTVTREKLPVDTQVVVLQ